MGRRRRVRGEAFGAAEADRQLHHLQRVEEAEGFRLAAMDADREGRADARALRGEDARLIGPGRQIAEPEHLLHLGVALKVGADHAGVLGRPADAQFERFEAAAEHPGGVRIERRAERRTHRGDRLHRVHRTEHRAADDVGMAADIFGERIERVVGAERQRLLPDRSEERVVHADRRAVAVAFQPFGDGDDAGDVGQLVGRVGGRFQHDRRKPSAAFGRRGVGGAQQRLKLVEAGADRQRGMGDAELRHDVEQQALGAAIERFGIGDDVAGPRQAEQRGRNRRHAGGEDQRLFGLFPDRQAIFEDFEIGVVEARIDEAEFLAGGALGEALAQRELALAVLGRLEDEGRGLEQRRLDRALGQGGVVAEAHHLGLGAQGLPGDVFLAIAAHRSPGTRVRRERGTLSRFADAASGVRRREAVDGPPTRTMTLGGAPWGRRSVRLHCPF